VNRFLITAAIAAAVAATPAVAASPWQPLAPTGPQVVTIHVLPAVHGREVLDATNFAVMPGVPVTLRIVNTSGEFHTLTIPRLHVNAVVRAGTVSHPQTTAVTFNARSAGVYAWYCELCPAVHHRGAMHGLVYALVAG
jgi:plastocyanin